MHLNPLCRLETSFPLAFGVHWSRQPTSENVQRRNPTMMRLIFCLAFIFTNSVLAQASEFGTARIISQKWVATYAGEAEIDGLPVIVNLEEALPTLQIPEALAGNDVMVPSLLPVVKKMYRLNIIVSHNPRIQSSFLVQPRTVSMDGSPRFAYISDLDPAQDFQFVITKEKSGDLNVSYNRKVSDGSFQKGSFMLAPVPHILNK